ncbi:hypothetical protein SCARR_04947 [Pontiella sulfatireligans]|uniref:Uncharacterized protein n=1 Tax=Pontiella sulfatireligans TaxID=2750658 RepID=A0A6C2URA1_9BACT|nr:hypothetical protein SCARR_04947 [Pontiella sulfatireligans]
MFRFVNTFFQTRVLHFEVKERQHDDDGTNHAGLNLAGHDRGCELDTLMPARPATTPAIAARNGKTVGRFRIAGKRSLHTNQHSQGVETASPPEGWKAVSEEWLVCWPYFFIRRDEQDGSLVGRDRRARRSCARGEPRMNTDLLAAKRLKRHEDILYVVPPSGDYSTESPEDSMM